MLHRSCPVPTDRRASWPARVRAAVTAPIGRYVSRQAVRPHGLFGRLLGRIWISETAAVNDVALQLLAPTPGERICEIGFGPGRTLAALADAGADVIGVEISPQMVTMAARRNAGHIAAGRMALHHGDGTAVPIPDNTLDAVLAVHNFYFWPDPAVTLAEIARTLRPGGRLVLTSLVADRPLPARFDPTIYRVPVTADATRWLRTAGFTNVVIEHKTHIPDTAWLTAVAT